MSVVGLRLKHDLQGIPTLDLEATTSKKMIATTRSFQSMITEYKDLKERLATYAISCAEKLRKQESHCNAIMVFLHTNRFRKDLPQFGKRVVLKTQYPTNSSIDLVKLTNKALHILYKKGYHFKKAGVIVMDLTPVQQKQLSMFTQENPKHLELMTIVDKLNTAIGNNKVKFASQSLGRQWKMKQEQLSPRYSTNINEVITIKA